MSNKNDLLGFKNKVASAKEMIKRVGHSYALYQENKGFVFRKALTYEISLRLEEGSMTLIGYYKEPFDADYLLEDMKHYLDTRFNTQKEETQCFA